MNVPWITKDGYLDLTKFPIDSTLSQAVSDKGEEFANACRILSSMAYAGRKEASVFLCGLLGYVGNDTMRKEEIVEALSLVRTHQVANLLFAELESMESSNSTRAYIRRILKALEGFPMECVEKGFERLLSDPKWSSRMKRKFKEIIEKIDYLNRRLTGW
jgi:hypothetical protein